MLKTEPARIKYGAGLRPQGKEVNMVLPWVTVFWGGRKTVIVKRPKLNHSS